MKALVLLTALFLSIALNASLFLGLQTARSQRDEVLGHAERISKQRDEVLGLLDGWKKSFCRLAQASIGMETTINKMGPDAYGKFWVPIPVQSSDEVCK